MTRETFKIILDPLVLALRAEMDLPTWTAYFRALEDVPPALLASAVERAMKSSTFMPKPGELRQWAEDARQALIQAHPYEGCIDCEGHRGWRLVFGTQAGQWVTERCPCLARHQQLLADLGVGPERLALPAARDWTATGEMI